MRIYVAGSRYDIVAVRELLLGLQGLGHIITHDWTVQSKGLDKAAYTYGELAQKAVEDLEGIRRAQLVVVLAERKYNYRGAIGEMTAALALGIPVAVIGAEIDECIFVYHPFVRKSKNRKEFLKSLQPRKLEGC